MFPVGCGGMWGRPGMSQACPAVRGTTSGLCTSKDSPGASPRKEANEKDGSRQGQVGMGERGRRSGRERLVGVAHGVGGVLEVLLEVAVAA